MTAGRLVSASAGPRGEDVRSDLAVAYEPGANPLDITIRSKVDYLYGSAIEAAVRRVAEALKVTTGRLEVDDAGALEWVILARTEACLRRAGAIGTPVLPTTDGGAGAPSPVRDRLRRSRLYVPGTQPKLMVSAGLYGADGIILDLEDSVPPAEKDTARILVRNALAALDCGASERMVRVNQGEAGLEDLRELAPLAPEVVLLPKVEHPDHVVRAAEVAHEASGGGTILLMPILESPLGIHRAWEIAAAHPSVVALTLGLEDLSAELGAPRTEEGVESFLARQQTVYAARAAGVQPIASVYSDIRDEAGLAAYVARERALGFDGIGCIHPRQVPVVHRCFTPDASQVKRATAVVRAALDAEARGLGAVALGSKMVDPPVVKQAQRVVDLAIAAGVLAQDWLTAGEES